MTAVELGARLRARRQQLDVTRAELAVAAGVSQSTPGAIERGQLTREITVRRLARALAMVADDYDVDGDLLVAELIAAAGSDRLAPPSEYLDHAAAREVRRHLQASPEVARLDRYARRARAALQRARRAGDGAAMLRIARAAWPSQPHDPEGVQ